jgi:hypothetical protein
LIQGEHEIGNGERVPDRAAPVAFGSTANCTFPPAEPDAPSVIVIRGTPLTAVHMHHDAIDGNAAENGRRVRIARDVTLAREADATLSKVPSTPQDQLNA